MFVFAGSQRHFGFPSPAPSTEELGAPFQTLDPHDRCGIFDAEVSVVGSGDRRVISSRSDIDRA